MRSRWLPTMPVHVANFEMLSSLHRLTAEDEGLLFRTLRRAWAARQLDERPEGLPDRVWLATEAAWESLEEARQDAEELAERRRQQTEAARSARSSNRLCNRDSNRDSNRETQQSPNRDRYRANHSHSHSHSPTEYTGTAEPLVPETNSQEVTVLARSRRSRRAPADFLPSDEHRRLAAERDVDLDGELAKFRDHEFANPRSDWPATFRNWLRSATPRKRHPVDLQIRRFVGGDRPEIPVWDRLAAQARGS